MRPTKDAIFSAVNATSNLKTKSIPGKFMENTIFYVDTFQDRFDTAILISGDSDLVTPIRGEKNILNLKK